MRAAVHLSVTVLLSVLFLAVALGWAWWVHPALTLFVAGGAVRPLAWVFEDVH